MSFKGHALGLFQSVAHPFMSTRAQQTEEALIALGVADWTSSIAQLPLLSKTVLLDHALFAVVQSQRIDRYDLAFESIDLLRAAPPHFLACRSEVPYCVWKDRCIRDTRIDDLFETPCFLLTKSAVTQPFQFDDSEYLLLTSSLLRMADLLFYLDNATAAIVHLQYRSMDDSMTGYTLQPLSGIIYTDWTDSPIRYAEAIVHEASHSFLNFLLRSTDQFKLSNSATRYWSPWKHAGRPPLGILHGAWAFAVVLQFYARIYTRADCDVLDDKQRKYCHDRVTYEHQRLLSVLSSFPDVLATVRSDGLRSVIREQIDTALYEANEIPFAKVA